MTTDNRILQIASKQQQIGWHLLFRGFLSKHWINLHAQTPTDLAAPMTHSTSYNKAFSRLIQEIWQSQLDFWRDYQTARHQTPMNGCKMSTLQSKELRETITHLQTLQHQVEIDRADIYFPREVDQFIESNHPRSLQNYIANFGPAIRASIKRRIQQASSQTRRLWHYPGFTRFTRSATVTTSTASVESMHPSAPPTTPADQTQPIPLNTDIPPRPSHNNGAPIPHKHSRWKITHKVRENFRKFFTNTQPNN